MKDNTRYEWLTTRIRKHGYTVGAEIGCDLGETTRYLLALNTNLVLYAVDIWQRRTVLSYEGAKPNRIYHYHPDPQYAFKTFSERTTPFNDRLVILKGISWEMANHVQDASLDFVFIDADHSYDAVYKDIVAWKPKVKQGGLLCGHDIHIHDVRRAVTELLPNFKFACIDNCWEA